MSEVEIYSQMSSSLAATALFGILWAFLLWVAGRSASIAIEGEGGIVMKIAVTVFGLVSLFQFNLAENYVRFSFETAAHSLAVLKASGAEISARGLAMINNMDGTTEVPILSLTPDLISGLFIISVGYLIIGRLWLGQKI